MPSVRQYFYRSAINVAAVVFAITAATMTVIAIGWAFPTDIANRILFFLLYFVKPMGAVILLLVILFFGFKFCKIYKQEKSIGYEFFKMAPAAMVWLILAFYLMNLVADAKKYDCNEYNYNDELNGGVKKFAGRVYTIDICGSGTNDNHFFGDGMDAVELTVTDEKGELLVKRHYKVLWEGRPGHEPLAIGKDRITYQNDDEREDYSHAIAMPPTLLDWIRARVPLMN